MPCSNVAKPRAIKRTLESVVSASSRNPRMKSAITYPTHETQFNVAAKNLKSRYRGGGGESSMSSMSDRPTVECKDASWVCARPPT